jgi:hypothetical protein
MIWQDSENITTLVDYLQKDPGISDPWYNLKQNMLKTHTNGISLDIQFSSGTLVIHHGLLVFCPSNLCAQWTAFYSPGLIRPKDSSNMTIT